MESRAAITYDPARRRRARRSGREKGCWIYVPAVELVKAGFEPGGPLPEYRTWATRKGGGMFTLYTP